MEYDINWKSMNIFWNNTHFFIMAEISLNWFGGKIENFQPELFTITLFKLCNKGSTTVMIFIGYIWDGIYIFVRNFLYFLLLSIG